MLHLKNILINIDIQSYRPNKVKIHGVTYTRQAVVRIKDTANDGIPLVYATIKTMFVYEDEKYFIVNPLHVQMFSDHSKCYIVSPTLNNIIVTIHDFFCHGTLCVKSKNYYICIVEKFYVYDPHNYF